MNKVLTDYIRQLSKADKKTLSQKALKTCEEVGELARAVLPYDNAASTTHRFASKYDILEESIDTILCALSVAYELEFTDEEIEEMAFQKANKWGGLIARESKIKGKIPYEIHVTVRPVNVQEIEVFRGCCEKAGVKPIVLDLQDSEGVSVLQDVMTSSTYLGDNKGAYLEMLRVKDFLEGCGFEVVRQKIETVPWHPAAPSSVNGVSTMPKDCYFETHFGLLCQENELETVRKIAFQLGLHPSRNIFKKYEDGTVKQMLTARAYGGTYEHFKGNIMEIEARLKDAGWALDKIITEFSVYDTKMSHDAAWISK